jgi:hypothetical protein
MGIDANSYYFLIGLLVVICIVGLVWLKLLTFVGSLIGIIFAVSIDSLTYINGNIITTVYVYDFPFYFAILFTVLMMCGIFKFRHDRGTRSYGSGYNSR